MKKNESYNNQLTESMSWLGSKTDVLFVGQAVKYAGTGMFNSLIGVAEEKKLEFPVAENFQMGYCIGLSLAKIVPIAIYPRWNFLISATDQIVNHLDKLSSMSGNKINPKVIIRVAKGSELPVDPQDQHKGDFTLAFKQLCKNINIITLKTPKQILPAYKEAYASKCSSILVEYPDYGK